MIEGIRLDIWVIAWFIAVGMVNTLDDHTNMFNYQRQAPYSVDQISQMQGIEVGNENSSVNTIMTPRAEPEGILVNVYDSFVYIWKLASWVGGTLFNATVGLHIYLHDNFGVDYVWGLPIMIFINLLNVLGIYELWTKSKV